MDINLGQKIIQLRKEKNFTQEKFADKLGVSRQSVYRWETGESEPTKENIIIICKEFTVPLSFFYENNSVAKEIAITKNSNCGKLFVAGIALFTILAIVFGVICVWFGFAAFSTNTGDIIHSTRNIAFSDFFFAVLAEVTVLVLDVLCIIYKIKSKRKESVTRM